jgi:uracil-DNA glycosylase
MGLTDKEFYDEAKVAIVPMGFCFPGNDSNGGDLPPRSECAPLWRERIFRSLPQSPELILLVGSYAQRWHLGTSSKPSLTETLRAWRTYAEARNKPLHFPLPHPSWRNSGWLKKNPWFEAETVPALRVAVQKAVS